MSDSDFVSAVYANQLDAWMNICVTALSIYEYLVTIDQEVSHVWKRRISIPSIILFLMRWSMVLRAIVGPITPQDPLGCKATLISEEVLIVFSLVLIALFSGLRVYALWGGGSGGLMLFTLVFLLNLPAVAINAFTFIDTRYVILPFWGCTQWFQYSMDTQIILSRAVRIPVIIGDAVVLGLTWYRSIKQVYEGRRLEVSVPLSTVLFRDGTIYFLVLLVMNVLELCTNLPQSGIIVSSLAGNLPPILINRFMLNLRQLNDSNVASTARVHTISTPMFRISVDVAGNLGEPLEPGWDSQSEQDEEDTTSSDGANALPPFDSDSREKNDHSA